MITVYFESGGHAEKVATFSSEELYVACIPALKKEAENMRMTITESVEDQKQYFLLGADPSNAYLSVGIEAVLDVIDDDDLEGSLWVYDPMKHEAIDILDAYDGYFGYAEISEEEYNAIKNHEPEDNRSYDDVYEDYNEVHGSTKNQDA